VLFAAPEQGNGSARKNETMLDRLEAEIAAEKAKGN